VVREILNTVPTGLLVVAVVCLSFGGVVLAVWLIRRYVPATREEFNSEIVAGCSACSRRSLAYSSPSSS